MKIFRSYDHKCRPTPTATFFINYSVYTTSNNTNISKVCARWKSRRKYRFYRLYISYLLSLHVACLHVDTVSRCSLCPLIDQLVINTVTVGLAVRRAPATIDTHPAIPAEPSIFVTK